MAFMLCAIPKYCLEKKALATIRVITKRPSDLNAHNTNVTGVLVHLSALKSFTVVKF